MPDSRTKDADLAAIKARCELNYTIASHPKFADDQIVMAALANAKASETAFLAAVAEADVARGFRIWGAYRHCRQECAAADSAHAALRAAIESAEQEYQTRLESLADTEASEDGLTDVICWHFRGKPNTNAILEEKAEVAAHFIINNFDGPLELATGLTADLQVGVKEARQVLAETAAFLLSLIDQPALRFLGTENRDVFMDALETKVADALEQKGFEPIAFRKLLYKRYEEYAKCPWLRDKNAKDTFFWEFGKIVGSTLGVGKNILFQAYLENTLMSSLVRWKIVEILLLPKET
jgi:hypothetical protein